MKPDEHRVMFEPSIKTLSNLPVVFPFIFEQVRIFDRSVRKVLSVLYF
jgi:hypothetical protein